MEMERSLGAETNIPIFVILLPCIRRKLPVAGSVGENQKHWYNWCWPIYVNLEYIEKEIYYETKKSCRSTIQRTSSGLCN